MDAVQWSLDKWNEWNDIQTTITTRQNSQKEYETINATINEINENTENLISCININDKCDLLSENLTKNLSTIKAYLQVNKLSKEKMIIDETKILKNINEFMTRDEIAPWQVRYNGDITNIIIGDQTDIENKMIKVPVTLTITFDTKEDLIKFLDTIENNIFYEKTSKLENSILFRIDELKYDITQYSTSQDVEIWLSAYAYSE